MIDVVFLLIIFFMATAEIARDTRAELDLPRERGEQQERPDEAGFVINIDREGQIILSVSDDPVTLEGLRQRLARQVAGPEAARSFKVTIRADRNSDTWTVPVGGGFGKLFRIDRLPPMNTQVQAFYNAARPSYVGPWSLRLQLQFLFPKR